MGGTIAEGQRDVFTERLKRIERGGGNTVGRVMVGPTTPETVAEQSRVQAGPGPVANTLIIVFAAGVGFLSMLTGRVAAFHLTSTGAEPVITSSSTLTACATISPEGAMITLCPPILLPSSSPHLAVPTTQVAF